MIKSLLDSSSYDVLHFVSRRLFLSFLCRKVSKATHEHTYQYPNPNRFQFVPFRRSQTKRTPANAQQVKSITSKVLESWPCTVNNGPFSAVTEPNVTGVSILPNECGIPERRFRSDSKKYEEKISYCVACNL